MVHIGKNTRSRIVSKGISAGGSRNAYRGLVSVGSLNLQSVSSRLTSLLTCPHARSPCCPCSRPLYVVCLPRILDAQQYPSL
jgi:Fe-S cluster assembly scaffold protein SufB